MKLTLPCAHAVAKAAQEVWRFKLGPALGLGAQPNPSTDPSSGTLGSGDAAGPAAQVPICFAPSCSGLASTCQMLLKSFCLQAAMGDCMYQAGTYAGL